MVTIALSTASLRTYGLAHIFELAADAGFDAVEILLDNHWDNRQPAYLQRLSRETNLPIVALHSPFKPILPGWPQDPLDRLQETAALARQIGTAVVVAHLPLRMGGARIEFFGFRHGSIQVPIPLGGQKTYRDLLLNGLGTFEAQHGIKLALENMPAKYLLGRAVDMYWLNDLETLSRMPHLTLDTTHIGSWGLGLLEAYEKLKTRIVHVHLSNFDGKEHRLLENGPLPLAELLGRLQRDGYTGAVSLEVKPEALQVEDEGRARAHLKQMLAFCRHHTGRD